MKESKKEEYLQDDRGEKEILQKEEVIEEHKLKHREDKEYKDLVKRLNRVEGQVKGIRNMLEEERYCTDILIQVSAVQAALNSFSKELLINHINTCVVEDIRSGKENVAKELCDTLVKLMK